MLTRSAADGAATPDRRPSLARRPACSGPAGQPRRLAAAIRLAFDPHSRPGLARLATLDPSREEGVSARNAWPRQTETHWSYYRTNDVVHSTYWIAEWPRLDVGPDFLAPLLVQTRSMRTVSVTMEPVAPLKAVAAPPTFSKDVAPILYKSCVECHRPGAIAPMSLITYDDARPWARALKPSSTARRMRRRTCDPARRPPHI